MFTHDPQQRGVLYAPTPHRSPYTGYTLEELDQFDTLDILPYSLDSEVWKRKPCHLEKPADQNRPKP